MKEWIKIAGSPDEFLWNDRDLVEIEAAGRSFCLARHDGKLFALAPKCPHASGRFVHGVIDGQGNVVCPLHRYKFCLANGRNVSGEGYYLKRWPVDVRNDGVYLELQQGVFGPG
ncbi:MAG: (2Fe-2S)-binding protein [Proteobacteria bacterium]|nr:MAG: (2Fe-2S)-binding protein [Pseudomonadota bacterium]